MKGDNQHEMLPPFNNNYPLIDPTLDSYCLSPLSPHLDFLDSVRLKNGFDFSDTFTPFQSIENPFETSNDKYFGIVKKDGIDSILLFSVTMWAVSTGKNVKRVKNVETDHEENDSVLRKAQLKKAFNKLKYYKVSKWVIYMNNLMWINI